MIVLDCSAAIAVAQGTEEGVALWSLVLRGEKIAAPSIISGELANALCKYVREGCFDADAAVRINDHALALIDEFVDAQALQTEALRETIRLDHSAYDLFYLVLARRLGATVLTLDRAFQRLCLDNGVDCVCTENL